MTVTPGRSQHNTRHALVIGGSMGGLIAARVLADFFDHVTIIERDEISDVAANRKGVPQGRHAHGLLASGHHALESLFPGFDDEMLHGGAISCDVIGDLRWYVGSQIKARFSSGLRGLSMSRPLIESVVRRNTLAFPNIELRHGYDVLGLISDEAQSRVTGVRIARDNGGETAIEADLVVDASGRGSRSPAWLQTMGYGRPTEDMVKIGVGYTTRTYRRRPDDLNGDVGVIINPRQPEETRTGVILRMEHDRWIVTLGGWLGDHAPADPQGFLEFARSLPTPEIYNVIKDAEPLSDFVTHKIPSNLRRRYDRMARFPKGYLVFGDALCSFNPIYGQGMTVAALEGKVLQACLQQPIDPADVAQHFFPRAAKLIDGVWALAVGADFAYPQIEGKRPAGNSVINRYMGLVHQASAHDEIVCRAFFDVANLLAPPTSLFKPAILSRVLRSALRRHRPAQQPAPIATAQLSADV